MTLSPDPVFQMSSGDNVLPGKDPNRQPRWSSVPGVGINPIFSEDWYFCDEAWADWYGPFDTREQAREACVKYSKAL